MVRTIVRAAVAVVCAAALMAPTGARADLVEGLSIRAGFFSPSSGMTTIEETGGNGEAGPGLRTKIDFGAWGGGLAYELKGVPSLLNGEGWSTSLSVDFHYSERKSGIVRIIPVAVNQVYNLECEGACKPFVGFCLTAATINGDGLGTSTRWGGGLILGANFTEKMYLESRYEWIDSTGGAPDASGFRTYLGYRF